jgi:hypothetical protein
MNVQLRIITDENVDQLLSMSYSDNIQKLMHNDRTLSHNIIIANREAEKLVAGEKQGDAIPDEKPLMPDQMISKTGPVQLANLLKITDEQKQYQLAPGEEAVMLEITPEMLEDPKKAMYFNTVRPDGTNMMTNRYTGPQSIISQLSKEDQIYIIQQPLSIQRKILEEIYQKYGSATMTQKQLFDEGAVKTPFVGIPSEPSRINTPNTEESPPTNSYSPEFAPYSPAYVPTGTPTYNPTSPAYIIEESPPDSLLLDGSPYNPESQPDSLQLVGSPYNPSTPEQAKTNILEVEELPAIVPAEGDTPASGADVVKTITL